MNLKRQLFVASLLMLLIPWAGLQFVLELDDALRQQARQQQAGAEQPPQGRIRPCRGSRHGGVLSLGRPLHSGISSHCHFSPSLGESLPLASAAPSSWR